MVKTERDLEKKESSAIWDSNKGSCLEAPCGAAGTPAEKRVGETPLTVEEHLSVGGGRTSYGKYHLFYSG